MLFLSWTCTECSCEVALPMWPLWRFCETCWERFPMWLSKLFIGLLCERRITVVSLYVNTNRFYLSKLFYSIIFIFWYFQIYGKATRMTIPFTLNSPKYYHFTIFTFTFSFSHVDGWICGWVTGCRFTIFTDVLKRKCSTMSFYSYKEGFLLHNFSIFIKIRKLLLVNFSYVVIIW